MFVSLIVVNMRYSNLERSQVENSCIVANIDFV